jgi:hypothetical protein
MPLCSAWQAVVASQTAVVLVLLVGAALLLHSFWRMHRVDLGFAGEGVITMEMLLLNSKYREPARVAEFERQVMERVRALPDVAQASVTTAVPLRGGTDYVYVVRPVGGDERRAANMRAVDPEYFALMRIPVLAGRTFTAADDEHAPKVAVVSETFGRTLFGDASPIGRHLEMRDQAPSSRAKSCFTPSGATRTHRRRARWTRTSSGSGRSSSRIPGCRSTSSGVRAGLQGRRAGRARRRPAHWCAWRGAVASRQ